jgi:hypothetical protein
VSCRNQSVDKVSLFAAVILNEVTSLAIVNGRHPIEEAHLPPGHSCVTRRAARLCVTALVCRFVANGVSLDAERNVMLLSGPNFSGKSTYLRQCALIVYMAHIGCFVPGAVMAVQARGVCGHAVRVAVADAAQVAVTDRIFTRIFSDDSLSTASAVSTFASDCRQVAAMLNGATARSLLLVRGVGVCASSSSKMRFRSTSLAKAPTSTTASHCWPRWYVVSRARARRRRAVHCLHHCAAGRAARRRWRS